MMRSRLTARLFTATLALLACTSATAAAAIHADRDGDGVYDDLEARAAAAPASRELKVIVSLESAATRSRVRAIEQDVASLDAERRFSVVEAFAGVVDAGDVAKLAARPGIAAVEPDLPVQALNSGAQRWFGVTAARAALPGLDGNDDGSAQTYSKDDLVAAVLDTGIDPGHADLDDGKLLAFRDFTTLDSSDPEGCGPAPGGAYDDNGHGTHVAATIAGDGEGGPDGVGVAPGAALVGVKVLDCEGSGRTSAIIAGIDWVLANRSRYGIEAINLSLGGDPCVPSSTTEEDALDAAVAAGIVVSVAAGNAGPGRCTVSSPGDVESVITVGAIAGIGGAFFMADFSSRGMTRDGRIKPDVVAPGVGVTSATANTASGYSRFSGTSTAAPFVAGVALLMLEQDPSLTPAAVKSHMVSAAVDWGRAGDNTAPGGTGSDIDYGAGRFDAHATLDAVGANVGPSPVVPIVRRWGATLSRAGDADLYTLRADSAAHRLAVTLTVVDDDTDGDGRTEEFATDDGPCHSVDFDARLYGDATLADEALVGSALTCRRQDALLRPAEAPRDYTLEVESFTGSGGYMLEVSGGTLVPVDAAEVPVPGEAPAISGSPQPGETLAVTPGTWSEAATSAFRWLRCNSAGTECAETGRTGPTYEVSDADGARHLKVVETAAGADGEASVDSAPTAAAAPVVEPGRAEPPAVRGAPVEGNTLTLDPGTWTGTQPFSRSYVWQRCTSAGTDCVDLPGATADRHTLGPADVAATVRVIETVSNGAGEARAESAVTDTVVAAPVVAQEESEPVALTEPEAAPGSDPAQPAPEPESGAGREQSVGALPTAVERPMIAGRARDGSVLTVSDGRWDSATPMDISYRWLRCDRHGGACRLIRRAAAARYRVTSGDVGKRLIARVTATNSSGSALADSGLTRRVHGVAPRLLRAPKVSRRRGVLKASRGRWSGSAPMTFRVRWIRCNRRGRRCGAIRGAAGFRYRPVEADRGRRVRARVIATNAVGARKARSKARLVRNLRARNA